MFPPFSSFNDLLEDETKPAAAVAGGGKILDWGALGTAIRDGAGKVWDWICAVFNWVFGKGTGSGGAFSSASSMFGKIGEYLGVVLGWIKDGLKWIWSGSADPNSSWKGVSGMASGAKNWFSGKWDDKTDNGAVTKGWGSKLKDLGTSINSTMNTEFGLAGIKLTGWGLLAGTAAVALVVYGFYKLYKWWKSRKAKKSLSEGMSAPDALKMGEKAASMVSPAMIGQAFGPRAAKAYAFCCNVVSQGASSARVAEGTYRIMRNTGLKKSSARRIAQHTFCECFVQ